VRLAHVSASGNQHLEHIYEAHGSGEKSRCESILKKIEREITS
jgi:hypothetical protein